MTSCAPGASHPVRGARAGVERRGRPGPNDNTIAWGRLVVALRRGTTGASNERPAFANTGALITLKVAENTRAGQNVGSAVDATDADRGNRLTYSLEGPGKDSFTINSGRADTDQVGREI